MYPTSRTQIRLILDDATIRAKKAVETRLKAIYAKQAARGSLRSGATIKSVVTAVEEMAGTFITGCVDRVAPVARDTEAFAMIQEGVENFLRFLAGKVDDSVGVAGEADHGSGTPGSIAKAARELFENSKTDVRRQLEIHRFSFVSPQVPVPAYLAEAVSSLSEAPKGAAKKNRGGKPLAAHWDEMWAAIAVMLYGGELNPRTQADIEKAMKDWLAANDFDVGDTAVRERARKLWRKLEDDR